MSLKQYIIFLIAIYLSVGSASGQDPYLKGIALADQGLLAEAHSLLQSQDHDRAGNVLLGMADISYRMGDVKTALQELSELEKDVPGKGSYLQAKIHAEKGEADLAVRCLRQHLRSPFKHAQDYILLDESFQAIEGSLQWKTLWKEDWYTEEELLLQEVRYLDRNTEYLNALDMIDGEISDGKESAGLLAARGKVLLHMSQKQGSLASYTRAIKSEPGNADFYRERAEVYRAMGEYEKAAEDLERSCRINPEQLNILLDAARLNHKSGDLKSAREDADAYLLYFPDDPEANYVSGSIRMDDGKYFEAIDRFNTCLGADRSDPRYFKARGMCYLATSTFRYARNDFGMALDLDPEDAETWYMKGTSRLNLGDREGAMSDWEHAARLGSRDAAQKLETYAPR